MFTRLFVNDFSDFRVFVMEYGIYPLSIPFVLVQTKVNVMYLFITYICYTYFKYKANVGSVLNNILVLCQLYTYHTYLVHHLVR